MRIVIPMAGRGSRLRPHTLTVPKPLIPIAGKPMVQRIVEELTAAYSGTVEEIAFVIGDFGEQVEADLLEVAKELNTTGKIYYQDKPLGTAHAILCARESLVQGPCIVAFADTLFQADFNFDDQADGVIWVKKVEDPSAYGVVTTDENRVIQGFVEKSPVFVSDQAIVGIYYFKDGNRLKNELQYLIDNEIKDKGEYQLTSALENMKSAGLQFKAADIDEWLDCGNKKHVLHTNKRILEIKSKTENLVSEDARLESSVVIPPCYIGPGAVVKNAVVGPFVSIGSNSKVENSVIRNTLIQEDSELNGAQLDHSMVGNKVVYHRKFKELSIGDYTTQQT
ncbi:MAG: NTP transferase domain-containing protein [Bacteroidetes bacterium]|nr:NTP transferase domain-containing protein [Bacteroidota bacterium]